MCVSDNETTISTQPNPYTPNHSTPIHTPTMRIVDMTRHQVVKCGVDWPYEATPNCKRMITQLERNEALVTWLQPLNGSVTDQFPAIRIRDHYYTMSLRMMKAVWRHVRLKKNFVNRETIPHVGVKLRIPEILLVEKMRTQQRFNVSVDGMIVMIMTNMFI